MSSYPPYNNDQPILPSQPTYPPQPAYQQPATYPPAYGYVPAPPPLIQVNTVVAGVPGSVNDPGAGAATAGMVLGIIGIVLPFMTILPLLSLIFSAIGMKSVTRKGQAVAGLVLSIIAIVSTIACWATVLLPLLFVRHQPTY